jgi:HK97 gp10 family phage protein
MARGHKAFSFDVDFKALEKMLDMLPKAMSKTVLRNALKKAAKPIKAQAAANTEHTSIAKSMKIATQRKGRRVRAKGALVFVGPTEPHSHLVEEGTGPRYHANGKYVGEMPPNPFLRPAWDALKRPALETLRKEIENELLKAAKRLRTRAESGTLGKAATKALS